jgi:hypothetical protein
MTDSSSSSSRKGNPPPSEKAPPTVDDTANGMITLNSNQAFPHPPWQFAWKSPQWHSLLTKTEEDNSTTTQPSSHTTHTTTQSPILGHAAARIRVPHDIPSLKSATATAAPEETDDKDDNNNAMEYFVTATLQGNGMDIELQVWKQPQSTTSNTVMENNKQAPSVHITLVETRALQWPSVVAMIEQQVPDPKEKTVSSSKEEKQPNPKSKSGLVAVSLAR